MTEADRIEKLQERALKAEDLAERQKKMIALLADRLAKALGPATWEDGDPVCYDLPEHIRDGLCPRGAEGCAECWADLAEGEVNGLEYYLKPEYQGRGLFEETAQEFLERKRREAQQAKRGRARKIDFSKAREEARQ